MVRKHICYPLLGEWFSLSRFCQLSQLMSCKELCYLEKTLKPLIEQVETLWIFSGKKETTHY